MRLAIAAIALLVTGAGWAASPRLVTTAVGRDAPIGVYAVVRKDCSVGAAPDIRIIQSPAHGALIVEDIRLAVERGGSCAPVVAMARQVTYRPAAGFSGQDEVLFEIVDRGTGRSDPHRVTIIVQPAPMGI